MNVEFWVMVLGYIVFSLSDQQSVVPDLDSHLCTANITDKLFPGLHFTVISLVFGEFAELFLGFEGRSTFRVTEPSLCVHTSAVNISQTCVNLGFSGEWKNAMIKYEI